MTSRKFVKMLSRKRKELERSKKSLEKHLINSVTWNANFNELILNCLIMTRHWKQKNNSCGKDEPKQEFHQTVASIRIGGQNIGCDLCHQAVFQRNKNMKSSDWKQLYQAVDELYPLFKDRLLKELSFSPNSRCKFLTLCVLASLNRRHKAWLNSQVLPSGDG